MSYSQLQSDLAGYGVDVTKLSAVAPSAGAAGTPTATTTVAGTVKQMTHIANLAAAPTMADFNNLLAVLAAAGHMA